MPQTTLNEGSASVITRRLRGFWEYYRGYTQTAVHAASAAALTAFGLLVFVDPLFVVLAVASYVCPPLLLYGFGADVGGPDSSRADAVRSGFGASSDGTSDRDSDSDDGDSDSDSDGGDTDSDGCDADADG